MAFNPTRSYSRHDAGGADEDEGDWQHVNSTVLAKPRTEKKKNAKGNGLGLSSSATSTPSRVELLNIVRKHSSSIGQHSNEDAEIDPQFWCELLDLFFVRGIVDREEEKADDDLVFFVRLQSSPYSDSYPSESDDPSVQPFFVRRWAPELVKVIGSTTGQVDWPRSFYLNLICHTEFSLTVAICSRQGLQNRDKDSNAPLAPIYKVTNRVYASPSRANFQSDFRSKAVETVPAYPNVCFVVDDYDNTFEDVILTDPDHCYCVLLNARGGAALPPELLPEPETELRAEGQVTPSRVTLFSGFVSYEMVRNAFEGGKMRLGGLLQQISGSGKSERLIMRGPGGRGALDVAVSSVPVLEASDQGQPSSPSTPGGKTGFSSIMRIAATAAKQAMTVANQRLDPNAPLPLRCCLMSLSLPWDTLANDLLFKELTTKDT
ncbi:uncharacterized protein [Physcomitrium patens]|uniref:uncharacterized protein isoform X1 n=1 Tax=Physcomitrium patens TaxID=3218 RepID=UPI003CCD4D3A